MKGPRIVEEEQLELISTRVAPGDRWRLTADTQGIIYDSLTDALEAWFNVVGEPVSFRLDPLDSKLYAIRTEQVEIAPEPVKRFSIYGDFAEDTNQ